MYTRSNHPTKIKKNIPVVVEKKFREMSSSEKCFDLNITICQNALTRAGHKYKLVYSQKSEKNVVQEGQEAKLEGYCSIS